MHIAALLLALTTQTADTIRPKVRSPQVDGRIYGRHAARVRAWMGEGDKKQLRAEWTNVPTIGDSAGKRVHRWVTRGSQLAANGDTVRWELKQTYDARTLAPYGIVRNASNGNAYNYRIDGKRVTRHQARE